MEGLSASNCRRNVVNLVISVKGTTPDKNCITTTLDLSIEGVQ